MNETVRDFLFANRDEKYALFTSKLTPSVDSSLFLGIKIPIIKKFAKEFIKSEEFILFLHSLPHKYFEENILHAALINEIKDYPLAIKEIEAFLPYVDNWSVSDTIIPRSFKKNKGDLHGKIEEWSHSEKTYTIRFAIISLMRYFLDDDFKKEDLKIPSSIRSEEYYVNMAIAWYFATALAKQYDSTIPYLENKSLPKWTHNKTIQKAIESYRVSEEHKQYLRTLRLQ
ncbi:MAG: DNA alkylation repair protein [Bacilli bacterium]|nr:DNA alkylation repair protein [Bacilli bacterium]